jgi:hypothetical protein
LLGVRLEGVENQLRFAIQGNEETADFDPWLPMAANDSTNEPMVLEKSS